MVKLPRREVGGIQTQAGGIHLLQAGHTLFEILLALGLSLVLLVAVYSALDIHWKFSAAGREQMERSQVARALLEKLRADIRDVVFREDAVANNIGLIGNSQRLLVQVSRTAGTRVSTTAALNRTGESLSEPEVKDHRFIYWQFVENATETLVPTTRTSQRNDPSSSRFSTNTLSGLARLETDLSTAIAADAEAAGSASINPSNIIADEVRGIRFRYFDGLTWYETWDSASVQRLPRAVEVTISFRPPHVSVNHRTGNKPVDDYRQVILVPLSEPIPIGGES